MEKNNEPFVHLNDEMIKMSNKRNMNQRVMLEI